MVIGILSGIATFLLEWVLVRFALGFWAPATPVHVLYYAFAGTIIALLLQAWARARGRRRGLPRATLFASTLALLQVPAVVERAFSIVPPFLPPTPLLALLVVSVLAVFAMGWATLHKLAGKPPGWVAPLLLTFVIAGGLVVNRQIFESPFDPRALLADVILVGAALCVVLVTRFGALHRLSLAASAALFGALLILFATRESDTSPPGGANPSSSSPHVVLLVADTLRADVLSDVLENTEEGRALEAALAGSVWFEQTIAVSPWTVPSMGSLMTGLYPEEHGFNRMPGNRMRRLSGQAPTLAEEFAKRGYASSAWVTNINLRASTGMGRGFEEFETLTGATWDLPFLAAGVRAGLIEPEPYQHAERVRVRLESALPGLIEDGRPLFLWLHVMDPHEPLVEHPDLAPHPTVASLPELDRLYFDTVRYTARELAGVIETLDAAGIGEDAILVFTSDHGEMFPSDARRVNAIIDEKPHTYGHGQALYEELLRVPLAIRLPGSRNDSPRVDSLTSQVDLAPTIAELAGFEWPVGAGERVSLVPMLRDPAALPEEFGREAAHAGSVYYGPDQQALRSADSKLIHYVDGDFKAEFYDLENDPDEQIDHSGDFPERMEKGLALMERHVEGLTKMEPGSVEEMDADTTQLLRSLGYAE